MFYATSLNDKMKRSLSQGELEGESICKFPYKMKPQDPRVLAIPKENPEFTSEQLREFTKEDFEKKFTVQKLRQKWGQKRQLNYDITNKKFIPECTSVRAKTAKAYVKNLLDPDLFGQKPPRWNVCTKLEEKNRRETIHKAIFDANTGMSNFQIVPLKEKNIEIGVDSRYEKIDSSNFWNNSTKLTEEEKSNISFNNKAKALSNTQKYWNKTELCRLNKEALPVTEYRKKIEEPRFYKPYKNPKELTEYNYKLMNEVKEKSWIEREKVTKEVIHDNPGCDCKEKIDSLVYKKMYKTYMDRFNLLSGKTREKKREAKIYDWKDEELVKKIESIANWKDINWFKPIKKNMNKTFYNNTQSDHINNFKTTNNTNADINIFNTNLSDVNELYKNLELLKPLVPKAMDIRKEEDNVKNNKIAEYKRKLKKSEIKKLCNKQTSFNLGEEIEECLKISKYPIDKNIIDCQGKLMEVNSNNLNDNSLLSQPISNYSENSIVNRIQSATNSKKFFLDAFKKVVLNEQEKEKKSLKNSKSKQKDKWIEYKYYHPGTYREFVLTNTNANKSKYYNSEYDNNEMEIGETNNNKTNKSNKMIKEEKFKAWSCCLNTDENSRGCHKECINKHKWNLDFM